jgi:pimeloyl-ACP methyl ester carboxylesterase
VPSGLMAEVDSLRSTGQLPYDPASIHDPTLVIVGEWDGVTPVDEGRWLFDRLGGPMKRLVLLSRTGHRTHIEASRCQLHREINTFLGGEDED